MRGHLVRAANLDEAWKKTNKSILTEPHKWVDYVVGQQGILEDLLIRVDQPTCTLDIGHLGYEIRKWSQVVNSYLVMESWDKFIENLAGNHGLARTYHFKEKESKTGGCILSFTLIRQDIPKPYVRAKVVWRTAEFNRRFAVDLLLVSVMMKTLKEALKDKIQVEDTMLYVPHGYQSWGQIGPFLPQYGMSLEDLDQTHLLGRWMKHNFFKLYGPDATPQKYSTARRMQTFYKNWNEGSLVSIPAETLSLDILYKTLADSTPAASKLAAIEFKKGWEDDELSLFLDEDEGTLDFQSLDSEPNEDTEEEDESA